MCAHEAALSEPHERVPEGDAEVIAVALAAALAALGTAFDAVAGTDEALVFLETDEIEVFQATANRIDRHLNAKSAN